MSVTSPTAVDAILHGDCLERLREQPNNSVDMAFADPPFNIGFEYDQYHDDHADDDYKAWCRDWMSELHRVLKPGGAFWLAIGDEFAADLRVDAHRNIGFEPRNWIVWYYTFGQNCKRKFNRSHVHIFHFTKEGAEPHTFNAEDPKVRVPSARALVYGDKRANPTGRLPDDTWILRPQDLRDQPEAFQPMDDTWYYSRVAGTFKERQGFHGCQMPEQLLGRIVRISSNPGDLVLDPFAGSGTTLAVAKKLGRRWLGFELSDEYVRYANERLDSAEEGDELSGPVDPVSSSPTTAAGRRLKDHPLLPTFEKDDFEPELKQAATAEEVEDQAAPEAGQLAAAAAQAVIAAAGAPEQPVAPPRKQKSLREMQQQVIVDAFHDTHEGYSVDWLLCSPELQEAFHAKCRESGMIGRAGDWNRELLKLRKAGRLARRDDEKHGWLKKVEFSPEQRDEFAFAGEIAWAEMERKFPGWSLDALLCSPGKAYLFDRTAAKYVKDHDPAELRWAALRLRKARHSLATEAKQYHFVLEKKDFPRFQPWSRFKADKLDEQPGIYLLRNRSKDALYLGETLDLGRRLAAHAAASAPGRSVTQVGVILSEDLPSDEYRELLWVNLVGRYNPRLNIPALEVTLDQRHAQG